MKWTGIVVALVIALAIPAMALAQAPADAWCGGADGPAGTNFGPCPQGYAGAQVAGPVSGIPMQTWDTQFPDTRFGEFQSPGD